MTSIYPKIPGYTIYHNPTQVDFKKISSTMLEKVQNNEIKVSKSNIPIPRQPERPPVQTRTEKSKSSSQTTFVNHFGPDIEELFQPDYVKMDKQVLRFFGYTKESVVESSKESARVRMLKLCYYLVDDTIDVIEEREVNSGILQGPFIKRGKIKHDSFGAEENTPFINYKDLVVGSNVNIYGKIIFLYDCDQYTREFYEGNNMPQPAKSDVGTDFFHKEMNNKFVPVKDNQMKDYLEHQLGGGRVKPQKQFLENDRKVLKFFSKFNNLKYIIHYYLADDTVEIREVHFNNSGRDPFPLFLKRGRLPRKFSITQPGENGYMDFYKDSDIEPFMTLWAFNTPFKILGCDEFTQKYYMDKHNKKFPLSGFEEPPSNDRNSLIIPPYNGFGDEEDSLGNVIRLEPKPPKKDYFKYIDNDKVILRFLAKLNTKVVEDHDRRFLISFFLADDSIQVYEIQNRNSGIWEGKFIERRRYKNKENNDKNFTISDFEVNKSIRINAFSFNIIDADEFTKKWTHENLK